MSGSNAMTVKKTPTERGKSVRLTLLEARYRALGEQHPDMVCFCKHDGMISSYNSNFGNYARTLSKEIDGLNVRDVLFSGSNQELFEMFFALSPESPAYSGVFELEDH